MQKIILTGYIIVPPGDLEAIVTELPKHIALTKKEVGCVLFDVLIDSEHSNRFNVHEEFIDRAAFESHQDRVKHSKWGSVSANIERHYHVIQTE